ncbi:hypothetical protein FACS1894202_04900 [Clostridia bacterium]|nr:hypothetical protein FACS1894202_04900 [Clostridia bacterium]
MEIQLSELRAKHGAVRDFQYSLELPDIGVADVEGRIRNSAGLLTLSAAVHGHLTLICDRCAEEFTREKTLEVTTALAKSVESDDSDDIFVCGDVLETDDILIPAFLLDMEMKILCSEDCEGLCPYCGQNLNHGTCECKGDNQNGSSQEKNF